MSDEEKPREAQEAASSTLPIRYNEGPAEDVLGDIRIENEVVAKIVALAAADAEGIVGLVGRFSIGDMLGRKEGDKGVTVSIEENRVKINIEVNVEYGLNIYDVCHRLRRKIKDAVEDMTGLAVERVDVNVRDIIVQPREAKERPRAKTA